MAPSRVVPTPGTIYHKLVTGVDDPRGEPPILMARAALLLASEPAEKVNGRVTYSQQILQEYGWISEAHGRGVDTAWVGLFADLKADTLSPVLAMAVWAPVHVIWLREATSHQRKRHEEDSA